MRVAGPTALRGPRALAALAVGLRRLRRSSTATAAVQAPRRWASCPWRCRNAGPAGAPDGAARRRCGEAGPVRHRVAARQAVLRHVSSYVHCTTTCPLIGEELRETLHRLGQPGAQVAVVGDHRAARARHARRVRHWLAAHHEPANFHYLIGSRAQLGAGVESRGSPSPQPGGNGPSIAHGCGLGRRRQGPARGAGAGRRGDRSRPARRRGAASCCRGAPRRRSRRCALALLAPAAARGSTSGATVDTTPDVFKGQPTRPIDERVVPGGELYVTRRLPGLPLGRRHPKGGARIVPRPRRAPQRRAMPRRSATTSRSRRRRPRSSPCAPPADVRALADFIEQLGAVRSVARCGGAPQEADHRDRPAAPS